MSTIPSSVLDAYNLKGAEIQLIPSLINATYLVKKTSSTPALIVQKLHSVFGPRVNEDIEAMTSHLLSKSLQTPELVRISNGKQSGALWAVVENSGVTETWRAQTYIQGITYHRDCSLAALVSAAKLLAEFHSATHEFDYEFVHCRPLHNTPERLSQLREILSSDAAKNDEQAQRLGADILSQAEGVQLDFKSLPQRLVHGDPKISNILFWPNKPDQARCLIDLDTVGRGCLAYELGDALRSWTNPAGEDVMTASVDLTLFEATIQGYCSGKHSSVTAEELASFVDGFETVCLELASRYATDVVVNQYFGWNASRFSSRREHNLLRAQGQLALSRDVRARRPQLEALLAKG